MTFLHPIMLFGLLGVLAPIIIHLLNRRRARVVEWGAMRFLLTYNPESPYVSLDDWFGTTCYECGYVMPPDEVRWCEICGHDYCGECAGYCHRCDETTCLGCLRTCPVCEEPTCISCMTVCPDCGRDLCGLCLEETLCPCHEEEETDDDDRTTDRAANSAAEQEASATPTVQPAGDARG